MSESWYDKPLPERLRIYRQRHKEKCSKIDWGPCAYCNDMRDAAVEIERLTTEHQAIKDATRPFWTWMYNQGYAQGHHDTVESMYTDVLPVDMETYHDDIVSDLLAEYSRLDSASGIPRP